MKIVITGATGFIGRNLAENFHKNDLDVVATGRSPGVGNTLQKKGILFKNADILDLDELNQVFEGAGAVIHSAAKTADWGNEQEFFEVNVKGTRNVMQSCKNHQVKKIIFISTPSVYFTGKDRHNITENDPLPAKQLTAYARTKVIAENEISALRDEGFRVMIFRPRAVYGPYDNTIIPRILKMAQKKRFPLIANGEAMTDITYIDNFIDAVRAGLTAPEDAWNEVYNISNGEPIKIRDWFAQVLDVFNRPFNPKNVPEAMARTVAGLMEFLSLLPFGGKKPSMTRFSVGYMAKTMTLSIENAKTKLNYNPGISNKEGFKRTAEWFSTK